MAEQVTQPIKPVPNEVVKYTWGFEVEGRNLILGNKTPKSGLYHGGNGGYQGAIVSNTVGDFSDVTDTITEFLPVVNSSNLARNVDTAKDFLGEVGKKGRAGLSVVDAFVKIEKDEQANDAVRVEFARLGRGKIYIVRGDNIYDLFKSQDRTDLFDDRVVQEGRWSLVSNEVVILVTEGLDAYLNENKIKELMKKSGGVLRNFNDLAMEFVRDELKKYRGATLKDGSIVSIKVTKNT